MMVAIKSTVTINNDVIKFIESLPRKVLDEVYPKVVGRVQEPIKQSIIAKLPDGDVGTEDQPPSRSKQSKKSRDRFPTKMKKHVRRKVIHDELGTLIIIGVSMDAGHVNFDHGKKAKTQGRVHKLWWIKGVREKYATPALRKQTQDIPLLVRAEFEGTINRMFVDEIRKLLK